MFFSVTSDNQAKCQDKRSFAHFPLITRSIESWGLETVSLAGKFITGLTTEAVMCFTGTTRFLIIIIIIMIIMMMMMMMMMMMTKTITTTTTTIIMMMMMMMIIIIIIIIIALKGATLDFYSLLTAPRTVSNTYAQVAQAQSFANHVQHIERLSHVQHAVCHVIRRGSSAIKFNRV